MRLSKSLQSESNDGKSKAVLIKGREARLLHFLDYYLVDGSEISLRHWPPFNPQENSWYSFLLEAELAPSSQRSWKV
jgi:hypothetical protein